MKLYQQLEATFKFRINSNAEIISYIKKLSEMGKFDEPKKVVALAIILDRLGKMEDETTIKESLKVESFSEPIVPTQTEPETSPDAQQQPETPQDAQTPIETTPETVPSDDKTVTEFYWTL
jgi:hypothetical protein